MTDSAFTIASVPLVAALIGGLFLLANTLTRRIERLYNLERLILSELQGIHRQKSPSLRLFRYAVAGSCSLLFVSYGLFASYGILHLSGRVVAITGGVVAGLVVVVLGIVIANRHHLQKFLEPYRAVREDIRHRIELDHEKDQAMKSPSTPFEPIC